MKDFTVDYTALKEGLNRLSGFDFEAAEIECRKRGDMTAIISLSSQFQARLAAKALGVRVDQIENLKIPEYSKVTQEVSNFLLLNLAEASDLLPKSDELQSVSTNTGR